MKVSFFVIASPFEGNKKSEKFLLNVDRKNYTRLRKKLFSIDKKKNKKKSFSLKKAYPVIKLNDDDYVVYGLLKKMRIEDIAPLDLSTKVLR